jgi:hypothetical protein
MENFISNKDFKKSLREYFKFLQDNKNKQIDSHSRN